MNRYYVRKTLHHDYEVLDSFSGHVVCLSSDSRHCESIAHRLNQQERHSMTNRLTLALAFRKIVIIPLLISVCYAVLGLLIQFLQGTPDFNWLAVSTGALCILLMIYGGISFIFAKALPADSSKDY